MTYEVPVAPGESGEIEETTDLAAEAWPMWEVFVRARRGISHVHIGSLHAPDAEAALQNARDVYTRRSEGASLWVVRSSEINAFEPDDLADYVEANEKIYRHATSYEIPEEVGHM
jgi:ring-1,2-phenylacetyl-CoA epoxidase subunit PaaB